jgi:hypothetical protein
MHQLIDDRRELESDSSPQIRLLVVLCTQSTELTSLQNRTAWPTQCARLRRLNGGNGKT